MMHEGVLPASQELLVEPTREDVTWLPCPGPSLGEIAAAAWEALQHLGLAPLREAAACALYVRRVVRQVIELPGVTYWFPEAQIIGLSASPEWMSEADTVLLDVALLVDEACRRVSPAVVADLVAAVIGGKRADVPTN